MTPSVPSEAEVRAQLARMLASEHFHASERLRRFLRFVVEERLAGRKERIKAYTIALEVFDKDPSFDSLTNPIIRMEAGKLRSKLEHYYCTAAEDPVSIDIPKGGYVPSFSYRALSPWSHKTPSVDASGLPHSSQAPSIIGDGEHMPPKWTAPSFISQKNTGLSVLVLPFTNIGQVPQVAPLLEGLVEELIIALTKIPDLAVFTIRTPQKTSPPVDIPAFIRRCGAQTVLSGSAQFNDSTIRMRVSLTEAVSCQALWADKFERSLSASALFEIQDAITSRVVTNVGTRTGLGGSLKQPLHPRRTTDLEAYEAVLHYHHWLSSLVAERFAVAHRSLKAAIRRDPGYGMAFAMLADLYAVDYKWSYNLFTDSLEESLRLAEHALRLDPDCQYANWSMAYNSYLRYDRDAFVAYGTKAVALNPSNTNIACTAGFHLCNVGEWDLGQQLITNSLELNPFVPNWYIFPSFTRHLLADECEAALNEARSFDDRGFIGGPMLRAVALAGLGRRDEAKDEALELRRICPSFTTRNKDLTRRIFFDPEVTERIVTSLASLGL